MISLYEIRGVYLISWLPGVIALRVSFPFEEILELFPSSMTSVAPYLLHLVLCFSRDKVRWWSGVVGSMGVCFNVWGKQTGVEYGVDVPLIRELELIGYQ